MLGKHPGKLNTGATLKPTRAICDNMEPQLYQWLEHVRTGKGEDEELLKRHRMAMPELEKKEAMER
jgi:hypothetical protein